MGDSVIIGDTPSSDSQPVTLGNWRQPPHNIWAFQHVRELVPITEIEHDPGKTRMLVNHSGKNDLLQMEFPDGSGGQTTIAGMLETTDTDGFLVLQDGKIELEYYRNGLTPDRPHILMSTSKSVTGMLAGILVDRGDLNPDALVTDYLPEARGSVYEAATIRHLLDMTVGLDFDEDYLASNGAIIRYREAMLWNPPANSDDIQDLRSFLASQTRLRCGHGHSFYYASPNSDTLGWVLERVSNRAYAELLRDHIWQPMGAEFDAYVTVDALGSARAAGGICCTLRDFARFGELVAWRGTLDGRKILPTAWITDTIENGVRQQWQQGNYQKVLKDWPMRYRNQWYVMGSDSEASFFALGVFGQILFIDPSNRVAIAKFSSQPEPENDAKDCLVLHGCKAIASRLD